MEVIFVHTAFFLHAAQNKTRAMATVVFNDGDSFSIPIIENEDGKIEIYTDKVIIDRDMRALAKEAILADCWARAEQLGA